MQPTSCWWTGPICGLGNRLIAIAAVKACIKNQTLHFPWSIDPSCPGAYEDIFKPLPDLAVRPAPLADSCIIDTHGWEPLEIYKQFNATLNLDLSLPEFCTNFVYELRHLHFHDELVGAVENWRHKIGDGELLGVHIRRTDRAMHHRDQFRAFVMRKQGLNRELPLYLSAMHGFLPTSIMRAYENMFLIRELRAYKNNAQLFNYAIFSDDKEAAVGFESAVASKGIDNERHIKRNLNSREWMELNNHHLRQTSMRESLIDLLCLSECDAIAQNNRASTFSVVASIIGAKPIITAKPRYSFWQVIEQSTSMQPNDPRLSDRSPK